MRADEAVGGRSADEKAAREKPEVARADAQAQAPEGVDDRAAGGRRRIVRLRRAVSTQPDVARTVAKKDRDHGHDGERRDRDGDCGGAPAEVLRQPSQSRQEDQLPRGPGRGQGAQHQTPAVHKPATGNGRREDRGHASRAQADHHAPQQIELPRGVHDRGQQRAGRDRDQRAQGHRAQAEAVHERRGKRPGEAEQDEVDRDRDRDDRAVPTKFVLQRHDQHAWRGAKAGRAHQRDERDGGDDPGVVDAFHGSICKRTGAGDSGFAAP